MTDLNAGALASPSRDLDQKLPEDFIRHDGDGPPRSVTGITEVILRCGLIVQVLPDADAWTMKLHMPGVIDNQPMDIIAYRLPENIPGTV